MNKKIYPNLNPKLKLILKQRAEGKKIVLCHGAFDLVHPGHLDHLEKAKSLGDILIITLTGDNFIKKNLHSPYFKENVRLKFMSQMKIADYVFIINSKDAIPAIKLFKPKYYCKGKEYKNSDDIGNLNKEIRALKEFGGKIKFIGNNIQSSSKFISKEFFAINDATIRANLSKINVNEIKNIFKKISKLKLLLLGETIIDKYQFVKTKGISPKSNTLSCITEDQFTMPGGALASYKFLSSFVKDINFVSIINKELLKDKRIKKLINKNANIISSTQYNKIVKKRVVEKESNKKVKKLLTINNFEDKTLTSRDEKNIINKLKNYLPKSDIVIAQDFGHNFFSKKIRNLIEKNSKFLSINVQTNSLNYGFNIINRKFNKADMFTLDEKELELFSSKNKLNYTLELRNLFKHLKSKHCFLTCGGKFSLAINNRKIFKIQNLNENAIDTVGAGDIFHCMSSILSKLTDNLFLNLLISQISGALAVNILGNSEFPKLKEIFKTVMYYKNSLRLKNDKSF